jgi:hypothetical protein
MHKTVFQLDSMIEEFIWSGRLGTFVVNPLSTGLGNVLQNLRSMA